jgi:hypothetical protein
MSGGPGAGAEVGEVDERGVAAEDPPPGSGSMPEPHEPGGTGPDADSSAADAGTVDAEAAAAADDPDAASDPDPDAADPDAADPDPDPSHPDDRDAAEDAAPEEPEAVPEPAATTAIEVNGSAPAPGPRFVPPPYDPTSIPAADPPDARRQPAVQPPAVREPVPQQYGTGGVPILEIEGGWEAVYRRRRRQTATFIAGLVGVLVVGFLAWLTYTGVVHWPFGGTVTVAQNVCTHSQPLPPKKISVRVFNGSARNGLAGKVAGQLKSFGFAVKTTGNDPLEARIRTQVEIRHGEEGELAAATMSAYVVGKVKDVRDDRRDESIDLVLGPSFTRLHSKSELKKSLAAVTSTLPMKCPAGVTPPTATPTPAASGTPKAPVTPRPTGTPRR